MSAHPVTAVTATLTHPLRGTDMVETLTVLCGELGSPHLSVLPVLGERGPQAEPEARTCAMLDSLYADRQPHGWRITSTPGADSRAARHLLASDLNVLADVIGAESGADRGPVGISLVGPVTLASQVHVHNGEKLQSDHGARRELTESWCSGIQELVAAMRRNTGGRDVVVHLDETGLHRVLTGAVPTASGYRTLRSLPRAEVREALTRTVRACTEAGAVEVALSAGEAGTRWVRDTGAHAAVVTPPREISGWEPLAALTERGTTLWFETVPTEAPGSVRHTLETIVRPWRELGMDAAGLAGSRVAPRESVSHLTPPRFPGVLRRTTEVSGALTDTVNEA